MKAFDLCSGIGGFRIGVELSKKANDITFVAFSDIDAYANKAYQNMFDATDEISLGDIQQYTRFSDEFINEGKLNTTEERNKKINDYIPDFDILFAGFPCQPNSLMGNRKGNKDARGNIFYDIAEIIRAKKPAYFILENVKAITSVNNGEFFKEIIDILANDLKYDLKIWSLNAADYGIQQIRRRTFFVGAKYASLPDDPPEKISLSDSEKPTTWHLLEKDVDRKYFLSEKILKTILKDEHKGYKRKAEINRLIARPLCQTMHKMHRASQDNYFSEDFINGIYCPEKGHVKFAHINKPGIRRITPKEALRIQSFPENYIEKLLKSGISDTRLYMLAGNAVPPVLVKHVINKIL